MTNEEKHKTPEERAEAFRKFCNSTQCNECECSKDGKKFVALCEFRWLALEAKKELLPCPYCNSKHLEVLHGDETHQCTVWCGGCGYRSCFCDSNSDAIARHNDLCRKVKGEVK